MIKIRMYKLKLGIKKLARFQNMNVNKCKRLDDQLSAM